MSDGVCKPIGWDQFKAWSELTGTKVTPYEFEVLRKMDLQFCTEMNVELEAYRVRQEAARK